MKTAAILVTGLFFAWHLCNAQQQVNSMAEAGRREIFIYLGKGIVSLQKPFQGITAYRVERKDANRNTWTEIGIYEAPATREEFNKRFNTALVFFPQPHQDDPVPLERIWEKSSQHNTSDSIAPYNFYLPVMIGLGYAAVDNTAKTNTSYQYRVSHRVNSQWTVAFLTNTVTLPAKTGMPKPAFVRSYTQSNSIEVVFGIKGKNRPAYYRTLRRDDFKGGFNQIPAQKIVRIKSDSLFFVLYDTSVTPRKAYEYMVLTYDRAGNSGPNSDTVTAASYNFNEVLLPHHLNVHNQSTITGLVLSWRMDKPHLCKGLRLYRSTHHDREFSRIVDLPPTDTMFVDQNVNPMTRYYYHFRVLGVLDESSVTSATVFGLYQNSLKPMPPARVHATTDREGIRVGWKPGDAHIKGYYIYRAISGKPFDLISALVTDTSYLDKSRSLSGKLFYDYTLKAESTSHGISDFSDTVQARPGLKTIPQFPRELVCKKINDRIRLSWLEMRQYDNTINSYEVSRSTDGKLFSSIGFSEENNFIDSLTSRGNTYVYRVRSVDMFGGSSEWSAETLINISTLAKPLPPPGFKAYKGDNAVTLRWGGSLQPGISAYKIYKRTETGSILLLTTVNAQVYEFTDKNIRRNERYSYYITVIGNSIESERSSVVQVVF